jgi:gamma-glutamylputrescine oxidase
VAAAGGDSVLDGTSYYQATAHPAPECPPLAGDESADVCIIGGGFTGLSAALELARAGMRVIVVEAGPIAWGASGRNGGQLCTGFSKGLAVFERALGSEAAKTAFQVAEEGKALIRERIARYGIDCDLKWGYLLAAPKAGHMADLAAERDELARYGYDKVNLLTKAELEERLGTRIYHGALRDAGGGHFHTLNYALGLARAVIAEGGRIATGTRALTVETRGKARVVTVTGTVTARHLVVACNAYLGKLVPHLDSRVMPVASYVIATAPLGEARARALIRDDEAVADANFVTDYFRLTADRRLLFGGRCSYSGIHPKDLAASMRPRLLRIFPQLAGVAIDYAWGGHIGITYNRLPDVGRIGASLYYAQGYSGQGVVLSGMFGKLMAEAIMGEAGRFDVFTRIRHAPFPGGILRRPALTLGMLYYRLRDLLA